MQPPFFYRLKVYFTEMFPILLYLPLSILQYFTINLLIQQLNGQQFALDNNTISGFIAAFMIMLMLRTFDDLKDFELDKKLFPSRPIPRGDVLKKDVIMLAWIAAIILVINALTLGIATIVIFGIVFLYMLGTFKFFFAEKFHREHTYFTMFTHQPLPYSGNFYLIHTALAAGFSYESFGTNSFFVLLVMAMPITIWEISRKIRSADKEDDYETFSRFIGRRTATILPILMMIIVLVLQCIIAQRLGFHLYFYWIGILVTIGAGFYYFRFLLHPTHANNILKKVATIWAALMQLNLLIPLIMKM